MEPGEGRQRRENLLLDAFKAQLLPPQFNLFLGSVRWRLGFIESIRADLSPWREECLSALATLLGHPSVRFLDSLELTRIHSSIRDEVLVAIAEVPRSVATLAIERNRVVISYGPSYAPMAPSQSATNSWSRQVSETLASLQMTVDAGWWKDLSAIAEADWPRLQSLDLDLSCLDYGWSDRRRVSREISRGLADLLASERVPSLKSITLRSWHTSSTRKIARRLLKSAPAGLQISPSY